MSKWLAWTHAYQVPSDTKSALDFHHSRFHTHRDDGEPQRAWGTLTYSKWVLWSPPVRRGHNDWNRWDWGLNQQPTNYKSIPLPQLPQWIFEDFIPELQQNVPLTVLVLLLSVRKMTFRIWKKYQSTNLPKNCSPTSLLGMPASGK